MLSMVYVYFALSLAFGADIESLGSADFRDRDAAFRRLQRSSVVRLGVPAVRTLVPAPAVVARIVTFKNADTPEQFLNTARTKLAELGVTGEPQLPIHLTGDRAGEPKRRIVRIKGVAIVGFLLLVTELSAADSLKLQESGLGGRTHLGCGFFTPAKTEGTR